VNFIDGSAFAGSGSVSVISVAYNAPLLVGEYSRVGRVLIMRANSVPKTSLPIIPLTPEFIPSARRLVNRIFPVQTLAERLSFWAYLHKHSLFVRIGFLLFGIKDIISMWGISREESTEVIAVTGLYSCRKDASEAVWLDWFCVAPEERGAGIGSGLLDFSIEKARETGRKYLRLYTSDHPNEAVAQYLYEKKGFKTTELKKGPRFATIYREMALSNRGNPPALPGDSQSLTNTGVVHQTRGL